MKPPIAAIAIVLSTQIAAAQTPVPLSIAEARAAILAAKSRLWRDPDSVRDAAISAPKACPVKPELLCVCVEANARNAYGGYSGISTSLIYFRGKTVADSVEGLYPDGRARCGKFEPFPELNGRKTPGRS